MALFGGRQQQFGAPSSPGMNERIEATKLEVDMVTDLFNRMVVSCHNKCIGQRYLEATLNKGESVCVDRCVSKYFATQEVVGKRMQNQSAAAQQESEQASKGGISSWLGM